jgi:hypothetical protein
MGIGQVVHINHFMRYNHQTKISKSGKSKKANRNYLYKKRKEKESK